MVIRGQLRGDNDTPFVFGGLSHYQLVILFFSNIWLCLVIFSNV
jgi:hypothetical protein